MSEAAAKQRPVTPEYPDRVWYEREICPEQEAAALEAGLSTLQARIVAGRVSGLDSAAVEHHFVETSLKQLSDPEGLPDLDVAAHRLLTAVLTGQSIALASDHDVDGVTSAAILYRGLVDVMGHPADRVQPWIGHRLKDGYGLSDGLVDRMLAAETAPELVVTSDNGSADELRINRLRSAGVDTIVTDHHAIPAAGPPASAYAFVSPARADSTYPDPAIAGCMVAWLLLLRTYRKWAEVVGDPGEEAQTTIMGLLADVAIGTVADCVTLGGSVNNRTVVAQGLMRMNSPRHSRPCWRVAARHLTENERLLDETDLAFGLGPRINARGRLDEAMAGVHFLLSRTDEEAERWWALLDEENESRKTIERSLKNEAMGIAAESVASGHDGILIWQEKGHPGVHGIVASRVVEAFGRPVLCVSPVWGSTERVTGSARGVPGVDVARAFQRIAQKHPDLLIKHGGHVGAGGMTLLRADLGVLSEAWTNACQEQLEQGQVDVGPKVALDQWPEGLRPSLDTVHELRALAPYGRGFENPIFAFRGIMRGVRSMGDGTHFRFDLDMGVDRIRVVAFGMLDPAQPMPWSEGQPVSVAGQLTINHFRQQANLQLQVADMRPE